MAVSDSEYFDNQETISRIARESLLNQRLQAQLRHIYDYSPAAKAVFGQAGVTLADISSAADLARLPVTRKEDLIRLQQEHPPYGGLVAVHPAELERVFISPGPVYEVQGSDLKWFSRAFWAAGFRRGQIVINAFIYHLSPAGMLMHEGLRQCGATVVVAGTGNSEIQLRAMVHLKVSGFIGTPTFLMMLIGKAEESGQDFTRDYYLERAWFTGEPLAPSVRRTLEGTYNIDTFQAYAVTEPGGVIAYECREKNGLHIMDDYALEIVDPATGMPVEPGEKGEIVVTPVHNKIWGLVRFGTGDLSAVNPEPCPCGRSAPRLTGIMGRTGEAVKVRGMFVVGREVDEIINAFEPVRRYQLTISRTGQRDSAELVVCLGENACPGPALEAEIAEEFQKRCRLKLDGVSIVTEDSLAEGCPKICDNRKWD